MKHTKLAKAGLGAGLLLAVSGTAALANTAFEQTHISVTVTPDTESIALESSCTVGADKVAILDITSDRVGRIGHGLTNGTRVQFSEIVDITSLSINTTYYVINRNANSFQLALTPGGTAIDLIGGYDGTGDLRQCVPDFLFDVDAIMTRGDIVVLDHVDGATQHLDYKTDWAGDTINVTAGGPSAATELGATSFTLNVTATSPTTRAGEAPGTGSTQGLQSTAAAPLITDIDGTEAQVQATSALSFTTHAGIDADIGTSTFTLTYSLDGNPAR